MTRDSNQKQPSRRPMGGLRGPISPLWFGAVLFGLLLLANALSTGTDASVRALLQVDSAKVVNFRLP